MKPTIFHFRDGAVGVGTRAGEFRNQPFADVGKAMEALRNPAARDAARRIIREVAGKERAKLARASKKPSGPAPGM